ncbi:MAG: DUF418 domain-containing protein [Alistipes sp.]|nr:DUF418 domain-containing protein [Alistipes sp.]
MNTAQLHKPGRLEVVDALRGFAVMAILLLHNVEHFIFSVYPTSSPEWLSVIDKGVFNAAFTLFGGKAYAIFSLLFGFTFYIQCENQRREGRDFGYRFLWRLCGLALFATLNAAFFPGGDVLMLYAIVGIILFFVRNLSDKVILVLAILFTLQPMEWYHYIMSLVDASYQLPDYAVGPMYDKVGEVTRAGNFLDFIWCNVTLGQKASFMWAVGAGRTLQTVGLFLIGLWLGRKQLFVQSEKNTKIWVKVLIISAILFAPLYTLRAEIMQGSAIVQSTVGTVFDMWHKLAFTFVLVSSFVLLYQSEKFRDRVANLRFYGRMSLTNYVSQSIIGMLIYMPYGLYLAPKCGYAVSLLIGVVIFLVQVQFCKLWFKHHKHGPLEELWHKWTWIGR